MMSMTQHGIVNRWPAARVRACCVAHVASANEQTRQQDRVRLPARRKSHAARISAGQVGHRGGAAGGCGWCAELIGVIQKK